MLDYLLSNLVYYWNLFEINNWADLLAVGTVPSIYFVVIVALIVKIIHMHVNSTSRVVKAMLVQQKKEIALFAEFESYQKEFDILFKKRQEHSDRISNAFSNNNPLRTRIARYKAANEELQNRSEE